MIIETTTSQVVANALLAGTVAGRVDLEGVDLLVLQDGRILVNETNHRCTVRGSARDALTPYQLARAGGVGYRLRSRRPFASSLNA